MFPLVTDPTQMIWYHADTTTFDLPKFREGILVYEATQDDHDIISRCINLFNSEIQWEGMFTLDIALKRLQLNNRFFILLDNNKVLGHVWFDEGYLYNFFVSQNRIKGDSQDFCKYVCSLINKKITLFCVKDNIRGQKFFEGVGFTKIDSYI